MNELEDKQLASLLGCFSRLRSSKRFSRRDVLEFLDQAEEIILVLRANTIEAEGFNDMLQDQIDRVAAANRKLAQVATQLTNVGHYGTA